MKGRTIRLYLVDGLPTGVLTAEIINWSGKVLVAPRAQLADLALRSEVKRTGVYFLVGADPQAPLRDRIYVGEGDNVLQRLTSHDKDESKEFWTRTAVVISKDENLTKAHGRYLESRLIEMAKAADRVSLANGTSPDTNPLPEPDIADMEFFLSQVQMIMPVLGFNFLQPKPIPNLATLAVNRSPRFVMRDVGTNAFAVETGGEFVVLKGSSARKQGVESWTSYKTLRDQLLNEGKLADGPEADYYIFAEDVAFASPSAGAAVVAGRNTNGRKSWKIEGSGQTYEDWHIAKIANATQKTEHGGL